MVHKTHPYINFYHLADSKVISNQPANLRQKKPNLGESWADKKKQVWRISSHYWIKSAFRFDVRNYEMFHTI